MKIKVGCSSFRNAKWKRVFYPEEMPGRDWFAFYCSHFDTFEINATFYKAPTLRIMSNWFDRAPDGFSYSVKAPKIITHIKRFLDCEPELQEFYGVCRDGLKHKLAYVLFQFPPSFTFTEERLEAITSQLDRGFRNVVEFRHESWWQDSVKKHLAENDVLFCSVSHPKLPSGITPSNHNFYLRLHGTPNMFYSEYPESELASLARQTSGLNGFVYFNNTADVGGIANALRFKELVKSTRP